MKRLCALIGFVAVLGLIVSCGGKAPAKVQAAAPPQAPAAPLPADGVIAALPVHISFADKDGMVPKLSPKGLSTPESWGTWSSAKEATLQFNFAEPVPAAAIATLEYHALANPQHPQNFTFSWNGKSLGSQTFKDGSTNHTAFDLSGQIAKTNTLTIEVPDAVTPKALGMGADARELGIALQSIEFTAK